jgi:hypothetical protein
MEKYEPDRQELVAYEAPLLEPARAQYGGQSRTTPGELSNIFCNECHADT